MLNIDIPVSDRTFTNPTFQSDIIRSFIEVSLERYLIWKYRNKIESWSLMLLTSKPWLNIYHGVLLSFDRYISKQRKDSVALKWHEKNTPRFLDNSTVFLRILYNLGTFQQENAKKVSDLFSLWICSWAHSGLYTQSKWQTEKYSCSSECLRCVLF